MNRSIHIFDNGVKVYEEQLNQNLRERLLSRNVHETEEEDLFVELVQSIPPNGCFVNIGKAIGYYHLLAKTISPSLNIHAIEPLKNIENIL